MAIEIPSRPMPTALTRHDPAEEIAMMNSVSQTHRKDSPPHQRDGMGRRMVANVAALVLVLATGVPMRSAERLLPDPDDRTPPFMGI